MRQFINAVPGFLPGVGISVALAVLLSGRLARALSAARLSAAFLVIGFGIVISATLLPLRGSLGRPAPPMGTCDLHVGLIPLGQLLAIDDRSLNVLLFIPLGVAIGMLPWSHPKAVALVLAALLPLTVESAQLLVPALGRACQGSDIADNLSGLAAGLIAGLAFRTCVHVVRRRRDPLVSRERQ